MDSPLIWGLVSVTEMLGYDYCNTAEKEVKHQACTNVKPQEGIVRFTYNTDPSVSSNDPRDCLLAFLSLNALKGKMQHN